MSPEEYAQAEQLWPSELLARVTNAMVIPTWLPGQDRFWFRLEHPDRHEYLLVDAATGERWPAFDHALVARALEADPGRLPIESFSYDGDAVVANIWGRSAPVRIGSDGAARELPPGDHRGFRGPGGREILVREHNLWIREAQGAERQLTSEGQEFYGWAEAPDGDLTGGTDFRIVRDRETDWPPTAGCFWAPDGRRAFVARVDERNVTAYPYLENAPLDGDPVPRIHHVRRRMTGDPEGVRWEWYVIDVGTGERVAVAALPEELEIQRWHAWWTEQNTVLALAGTPAQDAAALVEVDADTGAVRVIHLEYDHMFRFNNIWFNDDNVRYLPDRGEFIWFTLASGWPHLWLIEVATGAVRPLTAGPWVVQDLVRVTDRHAFFTAGGTVRERNPYLRSLHRVDLDGPGPNAGLICLTPEDADHAFPAAPQGTVRREREHEPLELRSCVAPSGAYFVDNISRVDLPTVTLLRDADGKTIAELARADVTRLEEIGWQPPEPFCANAADGSTDLWGVIIKPRRFSENDSWPVLERIYGGHQVLAQPRSFLEGLNGAFMFALHCLADLGFIVVLLDGPGTPVRSREFRDMTWGDADRFGIKHHRAAIEDLASTRPWMDISCVGVSGHSSGGYTSLMCLLLEPDFYKVGFSSSPAPGPRATFAEISEAHMGKPDYGNGRSVKSRPNEHAPNHDVLDPSFYADRLTGRLALVYSDLDEEAEPSALIQFIETLVEAGKDFDLLVMPNRTHFYTTEPYFQKRLWDYFLEHVQGREPVRHHRLGVRAGARLFNT